MSYFKAKIHQIRFRLGLHPLGSLQRSPDPLAGLKGAYRSILLRWGDGRAGERRGGQERAKEGARRERRREGREREKGKGEGKENGDRPPTFRLKSCNWVWGRSPGSWRENRLKCLGIQFWHSSFWNLGDFWFFWGGRDFPPERPRINTAGDQTWIRCTWSILW